MRSSLLRLVDFSLGSKLNLGDIVGLFFLSTLIYAVCSRSQNTMTYRSISKSAGRTNASSVQALNAIELQHLCYDHPQPSCADMKLVMHAVCTAFSLTGFSYSLPQMLPFSDIPVNSSVARIYPQIKSERGPTHTDVVPQMHLRHDGGIGQLKQLVTMLEA